MAKRTANFGFRMEPEMKRAIEKAAGDDDRTVSTKTILILREWLTKHGYMEEEKPE